MSVGDLSRVIRGIVTGIGFVGAGAVPKDDGTLLVLLVLGRLERAVPARQDDRESS